MTSFALVRRQLKELGLRFAPQSLPAWRLRDLLTGVSGKRILESSATRLDSFAENSYNSGRPPFLTHAIAHPPAG